MKVTDADTGKVADFRVGYAWCGRSFSAITFEAGDFDHATGSEEESKRTLEWLRHLLFVRLNTAEIQKLRNKK